MSSTVQRKTRVIFTLLLVCIAIVTAIACQSHRGLSAYEPVAPLGHHHGSSPHTAGSAFCLIAVLPAGTLFIVVLSMWVTVSALLLYSASFVSLPFIPPRAVARQYRTP